MDASASSCARCGATPAPITRVDEPAQSSPWAAPGAPAQGAAQPGAYAEAPYPSGYGYGGTQQGAYPPGYGYGYYPMPQQTNSYAIASLVLSIVALCGIGSILGIIFGLRARREIAASNGLQTGDGLALAGVIIGAVTLALAVIYVVAMFAMTVFIGSTGSS